MTNVTERRHDGHDEWRAVRAHLRAERWNLTKAALRLYPTLPRVTTTNLLTRPEWLPAAPLALESVRLSWTPDHNRRIQQLRETARYLIPIADLPATFNTYAETVSVLDRPKLLEDRPTYRVTGANLTGSSPWFQFGPGTYFDVLNVGEATAHEYALHRSHGGTERGDLPLRILVGDPTDPAQRPMLTAITALTVRHDRERREARFLVHWRDPAKVATNGGYYQVTPVGMFQPAGRPAADGIGDFDLWRGLSREYSEELLDAAEHEDVDYERWPFFQALAVARSVGMCRPYLLGMGVDPLSLAVDILVVTVFEADAFDELFAGLVEENAEGRTSVTGPDGLFGLPFDEETVRRIVDAEPIQPAGAAALDLAWQHRGLILQA